jgi:hypothetical protein
MFNVDDLFIPEFQELAKIGSVSNVPVISAAIDVENVVNELGNDIRIDASVIVRVAVTAAEDDSVTYRGKTYRIAHIQTDSANLTKRIYLQSPFGGA